MGLIDAGPQARLDRYIGYYEPYATSHAALDRDDGVQEEVRIPFLAASGGAAAPRRAQRAGQWPARAAAQVNALTAPSSPRPRGSPRR